jgi:serine/threonine protein kinase/Tol biopolymer transport system component
LKSERWAQIEDLFHRAAECDPSQRAGLLDRVCNGDEELRREVEVLLASEESAREDMQAAVKHGLEAATYPLVGETVSHYRILEGIGGGGMGLVYRAEDIKLGRLVALKFLSEESTRDVAALGRFEREARSASALEHPNICPIYEFGEHDGRPFLVMQLLQGHTLRELISAAADQKPPFALYRLLDLGVQIAEGLETAHSHHIIHRDIKPANIFVTTQGQAKILDFGLAKLYRDDVGEEESRQASQDSERYEAGCITLTHVTPDPFLSRTGVAMGTAGYMSPEQARGEKLDARTDLFSFGLVLYEMATGQRAFKGDTGPLLHDAILRRKPASARELNPQVPAKLEAILRKALEKDRAIRYQSATEIRSDLQALRRALESRQHSRLRLVVAALLASFVALGAILWLGRNRNLSMPLPVIKFRQLTINSSENPVATSSISPSGKYLVYSDSQGLHLKDLESGAVRSVIPPPQNASGNVQWEVLEVGWFPDNLRFLVNSHPIGEGSEAWSSRTSDLWIFWRTNELPPRKVREHAVGWSVSPDGSLIAFATNIDGVGRRPNWLANFERETWLMNADGTQPRKFVEADLNSSVGGLLWSRDSKRAIYVRTDASGDTVFNTNLQDGASVPILSPPETKSIRGDLSFLPDGRLIYQVGPPPSEFTGLQESCNFISLRLDAHTGQVIEKARPITNWTGFCISSANATADGKRIAFLRPLTRGTIYVADLDAAGTLFRNLRHFTRDESVNLTQDWTNDSRSVIFTSNRAGQYGVYQQALDEDQPHLISMSSLRDTPITPDGRWLFGIPWPRTDLRNPEQLMRIPISGGEAQFVMSAGTSGAVYCAKPPATVCVWGGRTEDRNSLIFSSVDPLGGRGRELVRFPVDPNATNTVFDISPDGSMLAVSENTKGPIHLLSLRGQPERLIRNSFENFSEYHWAADGKGLYVPDRTKHGTVLYYLGLNGNSHVMWDSHSDGFIWARTSPDGHHLAIASVTNSNNVWLMENF